MANIQVGQPPRYANQSVTFTEVFDAVAALCKAATGLPAEAVIEWHHETRPNVDMSSANRSSIIWFRFVDATPENENNAGRNGTPANCVVEISVMTRSHSDGNQRDKALARRHFAFVALLINAFYGRMLFDSYEDAIGTEPPKPVVGSPLTDAQLTGRIKGETGFGPTVLTIGTMGFAPIPGPKRPRPEQATIETSIGVSIPIVLRVTVADVPKYEE